MRDSRYISLGDNMENQDLSANHLDGQEQTVPARVSQDMASLSIGNSVQLQIGGTGYVVTLIGYLKGQGFIVTTPVERGNPIRPEEGQPVVVRFFSDRRAHEFRTVVQHVAKMPYPHLHLAYPEETHELRERQHDRIKLNITGHADISDGKRLSCIVQDISMGGALIAVNDRAGALNDKLVLTLHVVVNGVEYSLSLDSEIRSVRIAASTGGSAPPVMQGLAFRDLSKEEILALAAFELLPDWDDNA